MEQPPTTLTQRISGITVGTLITVSMVVAIFFTRRNQRLGRGDWQGAKKLAGFLFLGWMLVWVTAGHHVPAVEMEIQSFVIACSAALLIAVLSAVLYMAVEPFVRRRMPELMIGWARLLEGRWRDPRVGRDVMLGALIGSASALLLHASNALPTWIPVLGQTPVPPNTLLLEGGSRVPAALLQYGVFSLRALSLFPIYFLLRVLLRKEWAALVATMVLFSLANLGGENVALETPFAILQGVLMGWAMGRVGLLGTVVMVFYRLVLSALPVPIDSATPYSLSTILVLALMLAMVGYALRISIGSRPLFSVAALDD